MSVRVAEPSHKRATRRVPYTIVVLLQTFVTLKDNSRRM